MGLIDTIRSWFPKKKTTVITYSAPTITGGASTGGIVTGGSTDIKTPSAPISTTTYSGRSGGGGGGTTTYPTTTSPSTLIPTGSVQQTTPTTIPAAATVSRLTPSTATKYETEIVSQEEYDERTRLGKYKTRAEIDLPPVTFTEKDVLKRKTASKWKDKTKEFRKIGDIPFFETDVKGAYKDVKKFGQPFGERIRYEEGASVYLDKKTGKEFKVFEGYAPPIIPAASYNPQAIKTSFVAISSRLKKAKVYTETVFKTSKGQVGYSQTISKLFGKGKNVQASAGLTKGIIGTKNIKLPSGSTQLSNIKVFRAGQGAKTVSGKGDVLTGSISKFKGTSGSMSIKQLFGKGTQIDDYVGASARIGTSKIGASKGVAFTKQGFNIFKGSDVVIKAPTTSSFYSAASTAPKSTVLQNIIKQQQVIAQTQTAAGISSSLSRTSSFAPSLIVSAPTVSSQTFKPSSPTPSITKTVTFPKVKQITTTLPTTKTKQIPKAATTTTTRTRTRTGGATTTFTTPIIATATIPKLTTVPIQTTTTVQTPRTTTITKTTPVTTIPFIPIVPKPIIPKPFVFALPSAYMGKGSPAGFLSGGFGSRYTPSFKALAFDIKGAAPKKKIFTGLELRPITPTFTWFKPKKTKRRIKK